jgi:hypothetical protein
VCCFCFDADYGSGIVRDTTLGALEIYAPVGKSILGWLHEEGCQGVDPTVSVEWDDHQDWKEDLPDGEQIIVSWFSFNGRENVKRLFDEESDSVRATANVAKWLDRPLK